MAGCISTRIITERENLTESGKVICASLSFCIDEKAPLLFVTPASRVAFGFCKHNQQAHARYIATVKIEFVCAQPDFFPAIGVLV